MKRAQLWVYVPLILFIALAGLLAYSLKHNTTNDRPSAQLSQPFPTFQLPALESPDVLVDAGVLKGRVSVVNVWGAWCFNCEEEMDELHALAQMPVTVIGIDYKDDRAQAEKFLKRFGNPYHTIIEDEAGDLGFELGVYGAPETFVVDANGIIRYHHTGALTREVLAQDIQPLIKALTP